MLRLYWRLIWARERSNMQYRISFWMMTAASELYTVQDVLILLLFFQHLPHFAGWAVA